MKQLFLGLLCALLCLTSFQAADSPGFTRTEDVIYARKFGTALTLDVLTPEKPNGYGLLFMVSGGFYSSHDSIHPPSFKMFLDRGYTIFAVVHGSQPKFNVSEIIPDIHRAVRFVRVNAEKYGIKPDKLGIFGASAGCHLSLMMGTTGGPGKADAKDPIDRASSAVQAVAGFFPPTDFLNFRSPGDDQVGVGPTGSQFTAAFGPRSETAESRQVYGKEISPIYHVSSNMPPTLIIHGDADKLVPIYQAKIFVEKAKAAGAPTVELITREGKDHGWPEMPADLEIMADWFDKHLRGK